MAVTEIVGWTIDELFGRTSGVTRERTPRTFTIREYQRDYAWGIDEALLLLEDLVEHFDPRDVAPGTYVLGSIIVCPAAAVDGTPSSGDLQSLVDLEVVDGQQRITTLLLLLAVMRRVFANEGLKAQAEVCGDVLEGVGYSHHEDDMRDFIGEVCAASTQDAWEQVLASYRGKEKTNSVANALGVVDAFLGEVVRLVQEDVSLVVQLPGHIRARTRVGATIASDHGLALLSFERANSRGLDLDVTDLLKNLIFLRSADGTERDNWDAIDADWKAMKVVCGGSPKLKLVDVVRWHHESILPIKLSKGGLYRDISSILKDMGLSGEEYLDALGSSLTWLASVHRDLRRSDGENRPDGLVGLSLVRGRSQMVQHLPLLLTARGWPIGEFADLARAVEALMFVYVTCGVRGQELEGTILRLRKLAIGSVPEGSPVLDDGSVAAGGETPASHGDVIEAVLKQASDWAISRGFRDSLRKLRYDSSRDALLIRYVLTRVEAAVEAEANGDAPHSVDTLLASRTEDRTAKRVRDHIDHLWPQADSDNWPGQDGSDVHQIGNLVLWLGRSNSGAGDAPASAKLTDHYRRNVTNRVKWLLALDSSEVPDDYSFVKSRGLPVGETDWGPAQARQLADWYGRVVLETLRVPNAASIMSPAVEDL